MSGKSVLNVGGNNKAIPLPDQFAGFEHLMLDIDPRGNPDIVCDARSLDTLPEGRFDSIYCSHNLEHYHRHEVPRVLGGFLHVLADGGFAFIRVPDLAQVILEMTRRGLDVEDVLYESPAGPVSALDVLYGFSIEIERSGQDFFAHKTGFTRKSLMAALQRAGFTNIYCANGPLELSALAFKGRPDPSSLALFDIEPG